MLRFQTALSGALAALLVVPVLVGQGQVSTLQDALAGTRRAIEVLKGLEQRLEEDPAAALGLILSATEPARGDEEQRDRALEDLRNEVSLLQMELDSMQSPALGGDGALTSTLGAHAPDLPARTAPAAGITTGLDDALRALLNESPAARAVPRGDPNPARGATRAGAPLEAPPPSGARAAYSADPLRHGIACYRAGRYTEAYELLAPLGDSGALYWQARTLERLERLDEAVALMERAIARSDPAADAGGFEKRRAETDLEFLRWKRDFKKSLPATRKAAEAPR